MSPVSKKKDLLPDGEVCKAPKNTIDATSLRMALIGLGVEIPRGGIRLTTAEDIIPKELMRVPLQRVP